MSDDNETLGAWGERWNKKLKDEVVFDPSDERLRPPPIKLGLPALDIALGGGVPRGRTIILYGNEMSGKTLLSQFIIAAAQKEGGTALFFDIERTYSPSWFQLTGVDISPDKLQVVRPDSMEQTFDMIDDALRSLSPDVIVLDSVAFLVPQDMLKAKMTEKDFRGLGARKTTEGIKKLTAVNKLGRTALIVINQTRVDMGKTYGNPETMPGGKGLRFASSMTLLIRKGAWLTEESERVISDELDPDFFAVDTRREATYVGFKMWLRTEKNKMGVPYQDCEVKFYFNGTVDPTSALVDLALRRGVIEEAGKGYFVVPGVEKKIHGAGKLERLLKQDNKLMTKIVKLVKAS